MDFEERFLNDLLSSFGLRVANPSSLLNREDTWTFQSSMGIRRCIDYILYSEFLVLNSSCASDDVQLGSDHRAVFADFSLNVFRTSRSRRRNVGRGWKPSEEYQLLLDAALRRLRPQSLTALSELITTVAEQCALTCDDFKSGLIHPWRSPEVLALVAQRKRCRDAQERKAISKLIFKAVRRASRNYYTLGTQRILDEFKDLGRLSELHRAPVVREGDQDCSPEAFADVLEEIYASDSPVQEVCRDQIRRLQRISLEELRIALKHMSSRRCADSFGLVVEMVKYGTNLLHETLVVLLNDMINRGSIDEDWRTTCFHMIAKSGDLTQATNYRPIAILPILYKIFSRILYRRMQNVLERHQCSDQTGFRPGVRIEDALVVIESLASRAAEFHLPLWIASLDLRKAFDRIEYEVLFQALRDQGLEAPMIALILDLYSPQRGSANGSRFFDITRGVKQGDVISSLLFNAALEFVFKKWKRKLREHGWLLQGGHERLTNSRYADDILLYAKSLQELTDMLNLLHCELQAAGLQMHDAKTKVLTTEPDCEFNFVDIGGMMIEILADDQAHRYLGRMLCLRPDLRSDVEVSHHIRIAWSKFHLHRRWLLNRFVSLHLRLQLFDAIVSPTAVYACTVLSCTQRELARLGVIQRKMLRSIVGWVRHEDENCETTMHRMKQRLATAMDLHYVEPWEHYILRQQWRYAVHAAFSEKSDWPVRLANWNPLLVDDVSSPYIAYRSQGRPRIRWDDRLNEFCDVHLDCDRWPDMVNWTPRELYELEAAYLQYYT